MRSLKHVYASGVTPAGVGTGAVDAAFSEITEHRILPGIFGRYYDLVFATKARRIGEARALFGEIIELSPVRPSLEVNAFGDERLGTDSERYGRLMDLGKEVPALFAPPDPELRSAFERTTGEALELIEDADRDLAVEFRSLVVHIVAAVSPTAGATRTFDGASSFMLWGAIFINAARLRTTIEMVETLIHEAAHQLLFGHSFDDALVTNPIEGRFESPLRRDPRPMIGVFHAVFVSARVHYGLGRLKVVRTTDRAIIEDHMAEQRRCFDSGIETVRRYGLLTPRGAQILDASQDYMAGAT